MIYRLGIGNVIACVAGFATLLIANFLAGRRRHAERAAGRARYAVLAGHARRVRHAGLCHHVRRRPVGADLHRCRGVLHATPASERGKDLARMIYGTLCFAMFFSFVGTVLGGLWADDSWGRFWGWDPKENGALMIVLWNALVLHARWGGMVKDRGLAVLAVVGQHRRELVVVRRQRVGRGTALLRIYRGRAR